MSTPSIRRSRDRHLIEKRVSSPAWMLVLAALILGGGALLASLQSQKAAAAAREAEREQEEEADKPRPFADMPPERPPGQASAGSDPSRPFGGARDELKDPAWQLAQRLAAEGEELFQLARAAKVDGDVSALNEHGNAAKRKLDEALELTAAWEEELIATYGEDDPLVREVTTTRNGWFDRVRWLHKSTSR